MILLKTCIWGGLASSAPYALKGVGTAEAAFDLDYFEVGRDILNDGFHGLNLLLLTCRLLRLHYQDPSKVSHLRDFRRD